MNDKKNIDRLFQERFKDYESLPDEKIWNNIHNALHEKKKRKVMPLWWKLSGIAAGFVLVFVAYNTLNNTFKEETTVVVAPEKSNNLDDTKLISPTETETKIAVENTELPTNSTNSQPNLNPNLQPSETKINNFTSKKKNFKTAQNTALAKNSDRKSKQQLMGQNSFLNQQIAQTTTAENIPNNHNLTNKLYDEKMNKIDAVAENNYLNKNITLKNSDSTALVTATEINPLEEILKKKHEKEGEVLATASINRWQVTTNVAPIYFNSVSNGSPIESQFAENSKSYENNLSVGIGVQYALNKKLAVRTGINKINLGYGTNDVVFFGALNSIGFSTLSDQNSTANIEVISATNTEGLRPFEDNLQNMESGVLNQRMGYYEVPLELSYTLINRKFGMHLIGGLSTLFLNENSVSVQSSTTTINLGKATNLNDIHFSSNIGLGFKYEFLKNFEAHFEPTFKYQFNTFSRDTGNFKPYFIGLYTGVSFKF